MAQKSWELAYQQRKSWRRNGILGPQQNLNELRACFFCFQRLGFKPQHMDPLKQKTCFVFCDHLFCSTFSFKKGLGTCAIKEWKLQSEPNTLNVTTVVVFPRLLWLRVESCLSMWEFGICPALDLITLECTPQVKNIQFRFSTNCSQFSLCCECSDTIPPMVLNWNTLTLGRDWHPPKSPLLLFFVETMGNAPPKPVNSTPF